MDTVRSERHGAVVRLTLNRPDKLNAFNDEMHQALMSALDRVAGDNTVRALILTGAGRAFSAGQDLGDRAMSQGDPPHDLGATLDVHYNPLVRRLHSLPVPTIAAVNGVAAGASMNIVLLCDIILAARSAVFLQPFANLGLIPDAGGTFTLPRVVGSVRARAMAMLADKVDAETAERWGLVTRLVKDDALLEEADQVAQALAARPTDGLVAIRHAFALGANNTLTTQLDVERDMQRERGHHPDYAEGVSAFLAKRKPDFRGRL
ncbi:MAG: 2-(1,2-epoxy-1,2-dihydrophenyl)acetyl-CoA isomerase PaaG [Pseudomonadota bacterium]